MALQRHLVLMLLGLILFCPLVATAQDMPADNMQLLVEKVRADKKLFVAEGMKLTENEAAGFWPVYDVYQDELFLLRARTLNLISDYAEALGRMDEATARRLLDEFMTIKTLDLALRQSYLSQFRHVLPEVKVARYYQIENKIEAAVMYELAKEIPLIQASK